MDGSYVRRGTRAGGSPDARRWWYVFVLVRAALLTAAFSLVLVLAAAPMSKNLGAAFSAWDESTGLILFAAFSLTSSAVVVEFYLIGGLIAAIGAYRAVGRLREALDLVERAERELGTHVLDTFDGRKVPLPEGYDSALDRQMSPELQKEIARLIA